VPYAGVVGKKRGSRKRKRDKRSAKRKAQRKAHRGNRFSVSLQTLEIAKGHDGLLRGAPEPVIVLAAYMLETGNARLVARALHRVEVPKEFPCRVEPRGEDLLTAYYTPATPSAILVLGLALEEDSGDGVRDVFAALEDANSLSVWPQFFDVPAPLELAELLAVKSSWQQSQRIDVMRGSGYLSERCVGDKWIGACAMVTPLEHRRSDRVRMHFVSADERNDWSAELAVHN